MTIFLDHLTIPTKGKLASAKLLGKLLGTAWSQAAAAGPFAPVYISNTLTLDFDETKAPFAVQHSAFRVADTDFEAVLGRVTAAGLSYQSTPHGPNDMKTNTEHGGRLAYWNDPDGHVREILTVSYARRPDLKATEDKNEGKRNDA